MTTHEPHWSSSPHTESEDRALRDLAHHRNMLLETRKRDGRWVPTPVNLVREDDRIFFRTWSSSGKAKRMRHDPAVRIAASDRK